MSEFIRQFIEEDSAQELAEYAYLTLFIGLVGILVWPVVLDLLGARYTDYNDGVQGEWEPPPIP
jgi:hypothetical protein